MSEPVLTAQDLIAWNDTIAGKWKQVFAEHPELLPVPCDIGRATTIGGLVQHIFAVELRYAQRLAGEQETAYDALPLGPAEALFAVHEDAISRYRRILVDPAMAWDEEIDFETRSMGTLAATRRAIFFHALLHSMRHYAQLGTEVRRAGVKTNFPMDYLFLHGRRA